MAAPLILFRNMTQMLMSVVQSQERAVLRSAVLLAERYLVLAFTLLFVAGFGWGLKGFFGGLLVAEGLLFVYCVIYALKRLQWRPRVLDSPVVRESMLYGLPLLGLNFSGVVTDLGDRYVLEYFCPSSDVGLYVAGYNLATYATALFVPALNSALIPVTMNAWAEQGPEETSKSLAKFLRYYALVALPVVFGIWAISTEAIRLLASAKYQAAAMVLPWVLGAKAIQGAYYPFLAGFFLSKKTGYLALFLAGAAVLNIALNVALIPSMGMMGAAVATFVAYAFYILAGGLFSQRYLRLRFPMRSFLAYGAAGLAMLGLLRLIPSPASDALALAFKIPLGMIIYLGLVVALDGEARTLFLRILARVRRR
jgi:O-antigen/teichoic acid export membrane protein